ncbi:MAG: mannitol-/sugar-/sorbitol-6-phosphatase [Solirubrobacteraceae bacterium]|jgi:sugar-phosphatase|nr:mannitol-/sugar-/sorbitol-6-phosphatase [Solirubrobacteraceae bacterium]
MTEARRLFAGAQALLVDVDGTLVDSSAPVRRAWTAFAHRHRLDPETVLAAAHGRPSRETVRLFSAPSDHEHEAGRIDDDETTDTDGTIALPGAATILATARPVAIVTSCSARLMAVRLQAAGLLVPTFAITSDDVTNGKPDPACFLQASTLLGVPPADCLALEDSPVGIQAARAAGIPVIAVRTTHADAHLTRANAIVDDLTALL